MQAKAWFPFDRPDRPYRPNRFKIGSSDRDDHIRVYQSYGNTTEMTVTTWTIGTITIT